MRERSANLDPLVTQLIKRLANPKPDSNVAVLVGYHPDPVKVCEAVLQVLALAQTRTSGAGSPHAAQRRSELRSWVQAYTEASRRGGWLDPARAPESRRQGRCNFFSVSTSSNPRSARWNPKPIVFVHGMYMNPLCWEQWVDYYQAKGYKCLAPA